MIWTGGIDQLTQFMTWLNGICQSLKFTYTHSPEGVEFIDLFVYVADNFIHTKLFSKKSDTHCYLIPTSCHKDHAVQNISFGVARRVRQNNSEDTKSNAYYTLVTSQDEAITVKYLMMLSINLVILPTVKICIVLNLMLRIWVKGSPLL